MDDGAKQQEAEAAKAELDASSASTHAASNQGQYEDTTEVADLTLTGTSVAGGPVAGDGPFIAGAGIAGTTATAEDAVIGNAGATSPDITNAGIPDEVNPAGAGLQSGKDQDTADGNDREAADRDQV